jgi:hypothetical protein
MGVPMKIVKKPQNRSSRQPKEEIIMPDKPSIEEIEKRLGIDKAKIRPILASPSDIKDLEEKGDTFRDWYEEELRTLYEEENK